MPRIEAELEEFYPAHRDALAPIPTAPCASAIDVIHQRLPFLNLDLPFAIPHREILAEARAARSLFFEHKANKVHGHEGWLTLSIIDDDKKANGGEACPTAYKFFRETFGFLRYSQVRFTILAAGGKIVPHIDNDHGRDKENPYNLSNRRHINIALNQPQGCDFVMENAGVLPIWPGAAVHLNTGNGHMVWNRSSVDRYHILVHGIIDATGHFPQTLLRSYEARRQP